jgi:hypothetical protein
MQNGINQNIILYKQLLMNTFLGQEQSLIIL